jgi:hypothetical protein
MNKIYFQLALVFLIFNAASAQASNSLCDEIQIELPEKYKEVSAVSLGWGAATVCEYAINKDSDTLITLILDKGLKTPKMKFNEHDSRVISKYLEGKQFQFYNNMDSKLVEFSGPEEVKMGDKYFSCTLAKIHEGAINRHCTYFSNSLKVEIAYRYFSSSELSITQMDESLESIKF